MPATVVFAQTSDVVYANVSGSFPTAAAAAAPATTSAAVLVVENVFESTPKSGANRSKLSCTECACCVGYRKWRRADVVSVVARVASAGIVAASSSWQQHRQH